MHCVLLSDTLDLRDYLSDIIRELDHITFVDHRDRHNPSDVRLAVAWHPARDAFDSYPELKAVCSIGAGADNILSCPSLRRGIDVVRVVDPAQAEMMSGFVLWHVIWHQRRFATYLAQQRERVWQRLSQRSARDVSVGILGYGEIGRRVANDVMALGFPVNVWSRTMKSVPAGVKAYHAAEGLSAMLNNTEILINLLPLTAETRGILNLTTFRKMKRGGYLIQVGRGEHLIEQDLLTALDEGQLAGASLDVFSSEPLGRQHPFWTHPKIIVTPHDACDVSMNAIKATIATTADAVRTGQRTRHAINRERGY
ncbi:glyoxylate/hydroxypyruvate reductase A [Nitrobacteraceae bacterium AZCC 1564]